MPRRGFLHYVLMIHVITTYRVYISIYFYKKIWRDIQRKGKIG